MSAVTDPGPKCPSWCALGPEIEHCFDRDSPEDAFYLHKQTAQDDAVAQVGVHVDQGWVHAPMGWIECEVLYDSLTAAQARQIAESLLRVADMLDDALGG